MFGQQDPDPGAQRTTAVLEGILTELGSIREQLSELTKTTRRPRPRGSLDPPAALRRR
jgi:hypothetical protein